MFTRIILAVLGIVAFATLSFYGLLAFMAIEMVGPAFGAAVEEARLERMGKQEKREPKKKVRHPTRRKTCAGVNASGQGDTQKDLSRTGTAGSPETGQ